MCKVINIILAILLIYCSIGDCKKKTIPLSLLLLMSAVVFVSACFCKHTSVELRIAGGIIGGAFFLISKCTGQAIGYGDSWLIMLFGIHLGSLQVVKLLFFASMLAGAISIFYLWKCGWKRGNTIPFVPILSLAYIGVMCV